MGVAKWQALTAHNPNVIREIIEFQHDNLPVSHTNERGQRLSNFHAVVGQHFWMNTIEVFIFFDSSKSPFTTITEDIMKRILGEDAGTGRNKSDGRTT